MKNFDVQTIEISKNYDDVFNFIKNPANLPKWALAFKEVNGKEALLQTPAGAAKIKLEVESNEKTGTIDWFLHMEDGSIGEAYSRVIKNQEKCIYTFFLMAPPVKLEEIEGALNAQIKQLREELQTLKQTLEL